MATALEAVVEELGGQALVMVDPNVRPWVIGDADTYRRRLRRVLARSDVVKVSEEDLAWLEPQRSAAAAARMLLQAGPRVVLLTRGGDGVQVVTGAGDVPVPAPDVEVVDTIGAGDAFGGGFLAWWRSQGLGARAARRPGRRRRGRRVRRARRGTDRGARGRLAAVPARARAGRATGPGRPSLSRPRAAGTVSAP